MIYIYFFGVFLDSFPFGFRIFSCLMLPAFQGSNTVQNDGSFAGTVTSGAQERHFVDRSMFLRLFTATVRLRFQVTPSNIFVVYPSIVSEITGLGFSFQPLRGEDHEVTPQRPVSKSLSEMTR